jgi:hypothetical protein
MSYLEKYTDLTADTFVRARLGGQKFIGPYDINTYKTVAYKVGDDLEAIDFLNGQVEKYSNNRAERVCTCDGNNTALREYQIAYEDCNKLLHYWGDFCGYVSSTYSDREYYQVIWDADDNYQFDEGLDDACKRLGMAEVGTRASYYNDYHYLKEAIDSMFETEGLLKDARDDEDYYCQLKAEYTYRELTVNQILTQYLSKFIESALEEQYKEIV